MNTTELLVIIEPHREMLKGMGWAVEDYGNPSNVRIGDDGRLREVMYTDLAARILCDVAMEALEKWALKNRMVVCACGGMARMIEIDLPIAIARHTTEEHPTRLAALLALLAWTSTQKGTT